MAHAARRTPSKVDAFELGRGDVHRPIDVDTEGEAAASAEVEAANAPALAVGQRHRLDAEQLVGGARNGGRARRGLEGQSRPERLAAQPLRVMAPSRFSVAFYTDRSMGQKHQKGTVRWAILTGGLHW